jgi:hypothetical protein
MSKAKRIPAFKFTDEMQKRVDIMYEKLEISDPLTLIDQAVRTLDVISKMLEPDEKFVMVESANHKVKLVIKH